ncbi:putative Glucan endo-1,3-beta-glucosidase precursor [Hibiscus syriacus]|uniref:Glucan endo-1,3-beta-glucosidase n=1 Tax=Hibiscus syriacus TaxID=106335 RepID=A0A6A2Z6U8_HIBSY|nr:putative Glucan endo-1,3-beta-glucosidase precursor [Hibiscus syriacus]
MLCLKPEALDEDYHPQSPDGNGHCNGGNNGGFILPNNWGSSINKYLQWKTGRVSSKSFSAGDDSCSKLEDAAKPQMCNYRYQLEQEVKKLQQQLQEETDLHLALASAAKHCGSPSTSSPGKLPNKVSVPVWDFFPIFMLFVRSPKFGFQAQELLDSIAVLEITVSKLEQEFVSLQYQLSQERNERRLSEYHLKHLPCHSTSLFDTSLDYLTESIARICNEEGAEENTDDMPLPEAFIDNNYIVENLWHHRNQLSEEMVLHMRDIFIFLADSSKLSSLSASPASPHCPLANFLASSLDSPIVTSFVSSPQGGGAYDPYKVSDKVDWTCNIGAYNKAIEVSWLSVGKKELEYAATALKRFRLLVEQLSMVDPTQMSYNEKLAFWINLYNALIMHKGSERECVEPRGNVSPDRSRAVPGGGSWVAFIDNLSRRVHRSVLWDCFSLDGKVVKVFIPFVNRRPNYKDHTFAFVHFASKEDLLNAMSKINKVMVDGRRIVVTSAKYQKSSFPGNLKRNSVVGPGEAGVEVSKRKNPIGQVVDVGKKELFNKFHDGRTYKDTVVGARKVEGQQVISSGDMREVKKPLEVFIPMEERTWLRSSLTGICKAIFEVEFVQREALSFWFESFILYKFGIEMGQTSEDPGAYNSKSGLLRLKWKAEEISSEEKQGDDREGLQEQLNFKKLAETQNRVEAWVRNATNGGDTRIDGNLEENAEVNNILGADFCFEGTILGEVHSQQQVSGVFSEGRERVQSMGGDTSGQDKVVKDVGLNSSMGRREVYGSEQGSPRSDRNGVKSADLINGIQADSVQQNGSVSLAQQRPMGRSASVSKAERGFYKNVYARRWEVKSCSGKGSDYVTEVENQGRIEALECWNVSKLLKVKFKGGETDFLAKVGPMVKEFVVKEEVIHSRFVAIKGLMEGVPGIFCFINVYGLSVDANKEQFFRELLSFLEKLNCPVCLGGDFNVVLSQEEKDGGAVNTVSMNCFRDFVNQANLIDLLLFGGCFTWCNNREVPTYERLDKFLVDQTYFSSFPKLSQTLHPRSVSDHNIILLENKECNWGSKPFRLFNYVLEEDGFSEMMKTELFKFCKGVNTVSISKVLNRVKEVAKRWSRRDYLQLPGKIRMLERGIQDMEMDLQQGLSMSRIKWRLEGDKNTRFFHHSAAVRGRINCIKYLKVDIVVTEDPNVVKAVVVEFFKGLFNQRNTLEVEDLNLDFLRLSEGQCLALEKPFSEEEVWDVIIHSDSNKAPGPNGLNLRFFKKFWTILKYDVMFFKDFYGGIEWDSEYILMKIMSKMGFGDKWRSWMYQCMYSASISVLVNGSPTEKFHTARGLRQGCSLSPLLFNLVGELLHLLLTKAVDMRLFSGFDLGVQDRAFKLLNFQFADDLIIFSKGCICDLRNVRRVLLIYELLVGLKLNLVKSITYGINIEDGVLATWANDIGCSIGYFPSEYLGRMVLVKSVLCSLPVYFLSIFRIPTYVLKKLNSIMASFLALLGKWIWKFASEKEFWWKRVDIQMRRNLADWEVDQLLHLISMLNHISISPCEEDCWIWSGNGEGCFSAKSCINIFFDQDGIQQEKESWERHIWVGIAPPRVETFVWQVVHRRVAVKEELLKQGVSGIDDPLRSLCGREMESVSHLFLHCEAYLAYGVPRDEIKLFSLMQKAAYTVGGLSVSAADIECIVLKMNPATYRPQIAVVFALQKLKAYVELQKYMIDHPEPLVHFALSCGLHSSPAVRIFRPENTNELLKRSMKDYIQASVGISNKGKLLVPKLLHCFAKGTVEDSVLPEWICQFLSPQQASMARSCVSGNKWRLLGARVFSVLAFDSRFRFLFLLDDKTSHPSKSEVLENSML